MSVPKCPRATERDESKARIGRAEVAPYEAAMRRDGPAARVEKCVFLRKLERFFLTVVGIEDGAMRFRPWDSFSFLKTPRQRNRDPRSSFFNF